MGKKSQSWRAACRKRMRKAARKENAVRTGSPEGFSYRWEHVRAVVRVARALADLTGADRDVVEAAAWLHDIRKDAGDQHPEKGAAFARKYLPKTDFPSKKIDKVAQVIEDHMGLWRDEPLTMLESQVLWDADKLTKIGLTGLTHWMAGDIARGRVERTEQVISRLLDTEWRTKTVASMHTEPARLAAYRRFAAFDLFVDGLNNEWQAKDLI